MGPHRPRGALLVTCRRRQPIQHIVSPKCGPELVHAMGDLKRHILAALVFRSGGDGDTAQHSANVQLFSFLHKCGIRVSNSLHGFATAATSEAPQPPIYIST